MSKKIKVQLTAKKSTYAINNEFYHPGDVFMIDENQFDAYCMVKVDEPKPKDPVKTEEPLEVAETPDTRVEETPVETPPTPKKRKRSTS